MLHPRHRWASSVTVLFQAIHATSALPLLTVALLTSCLIAKEGDTPPPIELSMKSPLPAARVKLVFEVDGKLFTKGTDDSAGRELPLRAVGNYLYEELLRGPEQDQAVRYYEEAKSEIAVDGKPQDIALRQDRRYVLADSSQPAAMLQSLQGPLTRSELDLIEVPGGSHLVNQLLPDHQVRVGETWKHSDQLLALLLNLDAVTSNDVTSQFDKLDGNVAQLSLSGKLMGSTAGVLTELDLKGKYSFDLNQGRITWLALGIGESRAAGLVRPGVQVQARLRMLVESGAVPHVAQDAVQPLLDNHATPQATANLLEYRSPDGRFQLSHDRRWHVFSERSNLVILRFVDDDRIVAQCNLHPLPPISPSHQVTLAQFQQEIAKALGSHAQQVVDTQETTMPNGLRQLRVCLVGQVANTPIQWIYYQIHDADGRRVTCAFTMSGEDVAEFGAEDMNLMGSLSLAATPSSSELETESTEVSQRAATADTQPR